MITGAAYAHNLTFLLTLNSSIIVLASTEKRLVEAVNPSPSDNPALKNALGASAPTTLLA
jgi:hypothetical protein